MIGRPFENHFYIFYLKSDIFVQFSVHHSKTRPLNNRTHLDHSNTKNLPSIQMVTVFNFSFQVFCWTDKWHGMTMEDIRRLEDKTKAELEEQLKTGEVRGTKPI